MNSAKKHIENKNHTFKNEVKSIRFKSDGETGLRDLLLNELRTMYYHEKALLKAFPKIIKNSCSFELIEAITKHFEETKLQIIRLEDIFIALNENPILNRCKAIECLIQDIDNYIEDTKFGIIRDAGIILTLHKIEHYEIAAYTILSTFAENINEKAVCELLAQSLNEEKIAELRLAKISNTIRFYMPNNK